MSTARPAKSDGKAGAVEGQFSGMALFCPTRRAGPKEAERLAANSSMQGFEGESRSSQGETPVAECSNWRACGLRCSLNPSPRKISLGLVDPPFRRMLEWQGLGR
jgi:hypothetical protein